jgi:D-glycero-D-manno-heptose 1,7-bisphosphate phosphatase
MKATFNNIWSINSDWTLFLDRDGTINKHMENHYIDDWKDFSFIEGTKEAICIFNKLFGRVIVVTNQQGIGKELMTHEQLSTIHDKMIEELAESGAQIDQIYYCPDLAIGDPPGRKPNPGMALQAQMEFPEINFRKSIMIGDQSTDIEFGNILKMKTVLLDINRSKITNKYNTKPDVVYSSLWEFAQLLLESNPVL